MATFLRIWSGQLVSLIGSGLTSFILGMWVYQRTGSVTDYSLVLVCATLPGIVALPVVGPLVDRGDRRRMLALNHAGVAAIKLIVVWKLGANRLEVWHIYVALGACSILGAAQRLAYSASVALLVDKRHLGRASGMTEFGHAAALMISPLLAGVLIFGMLRYAILIDISTNLFALATLLTVTIPPVAIPAQRAGGRPPLLQEAGDGWAYIVSRPGLLGLLVVFGIVNFVSAAAQALLIPFVLRFSSAAVLSTVSSCGGLGMLVGSVIMSMWGGPQRRVRLILALGVLRGLALVLAGSIFSPAALALVLFGFYLAMPISNGCSQVIWQNKTPLDMQGRVFAIRLMIAWSCGPLAYVVAGPLADHVFEPLIDVNGPLAGSVGHVTGVGSGHGMALMFMALGLLLTTATVGGYLYPRVRHVEDELPDAALDEAPAGAPLRSRSGPHESDAYSTNRSQPTYGAVL